MANPAHVKRFDRTLQALTDLPDPLLRLDAIRQCLAQLEDLQADTVAYARAGGKTWTEIGALYGLSKQGAQQRFRVRKAPLPDDPRPSTVDRG